MSLDFLVVFYGSIFFTLLYSKLDIAEQIVLYSSCKKIKTFFDTIKYTDVSIQSYGRNLRSMDFRLYKKIYQKVEMYFIPRDNIELEFDLVGIKANMSLDKPGKDGMCTFFVRFVPGANEPARPFFKNPSHLMNYKKILLDLLENDLKNTKNIIKDLCQYGILTGSHPKTPIYIDNGSLPSETIELEDTGNISSIYIRGDMNYKQFIRIFIQLCSIAYVGVKKSRDIQKGFEYVLM